MTLIALPLQLLGVLVQLLGVLVQLIGVLEQLFGVLKQFFAPFQAADRVGSTSQRIMRPSPARLL